MEWKNGTCHIGRQSVNARLCQTKQPDPSWTRGMKSIELEATDHHCYCPRCSAYIGQSECRPVDADRQEEKRGIVHAHHIISYTTPYCKICGFITDAKRCPNCGEVIRK